MRVDKINDNNKKKVLKHAHATSTKVQPFVLLACENSYKNTYTDKEVKKPNIPNQAKQKWRPKDNKSGFRKR